MKKHQTYSKQLLKDLAFTLLGSMLILFCAFPWHIPIYGVGLDISCFWALNELFHQDTASFGQLTFTYGPLGFLKDPLPIGQNFKLGLLFSAILRSFFLFYFLWIGRIIDRSKWLLYSLLVFFLVGFLSLDFILTGLLVAAVLLHHKTKRFAWLLPAILFAAVGFYIKSSIGVITFSIICVYSAYLWLVEKDWKTVIVFMLSYSITLVVIGLLLFKDFSALLHFWSGTAQIVGKGLSGFALYPTNNWWLIGLAFILWASLPFLLRNKLVFLLYLVFAMPLFAAWKHGMIREDVSHVQAFFSFLLLFYAFVVVVSKVLRPLPVLVMGFSLLCFYLNIPNVHGYFERNWALFKVNKTIHLLNNIDLIEKQAQKESAKALKSLELSASMKEQIGGQTVDAYPWELAYIPANDLNWQPRPTLQYLRFNEELDKLNARHFASDKAPEFLLWHLEDDRRGGTFPSTDKKYLLNEEPHTVLSIFRHYELLRKETKVLLFKKKEKAAIVKESNTYEQEAAWDEWIDIPKKQGEILRVGLEVEGTFLRWLKSKVYKDEAFYIDYLLSDGQELSYRLSPSSMPSGIWVNPFIRRPEMAVLEPQVEKIRFTCTNYDVVKEKIGLRWELMLFDDFSLFQKDTTEVVREKLLLSSKNDFEQGVNYWTPRTDLLDDKVVYAGQQAIFLGAQTYSPTFIYPLDSLLLDSAASVKIIAKARCWKSPRARANLVLSLEEKGKSLHYQTVNIPRTLTQDKTWGMVYLETKIPVELFENQGVILKVYGLNLGDAPIRMDNFEVRISSIEKSE